MSARYDVAIVGGGHNGLVAAFYLARARIAHPRARAPRHRGRRVRHRGVRARLPRLAGRVRAVDVARLDLADMRLRERGLHVDQAGPSLNVFPDGQTFVLDGDRATARRGDPAAVVADARAFPRSRRRSNGSPQR